MSTTIAPPTLSERCLAAALNDYAPLGMRVIVDYGVVDGVCTCSKGAACPSPGKHPVPPAWQKLATTDVGTIEEWYSRPHRNIGIKLGKDSGVVDIECDDAEAEETYSKLWDGNPPMVPTFTARRGKHRLFFHREDLPEPQKNGFKIGKLEIRTGNGGKGAQSVFPPSIHASGAEYKWLPGHSLDDLPLGKLTPEVVRKLWNWCGLDSPLFDQPQGRPPEHFQRIASGVSEGKRNEDATSIIGKLLRDMSDPYDNEAVSLQWQMVEAWNDRNRPPLNPKELEATFKSILSRERSRRTNETCKLEFGRHAPPTIGDGGNDGEDSSSADRQRGAGGWRLETVEADPKVHRLYSPLWGGYVELSTREYQSPAMICSAAIEQKNKRLPDQFSRGWKDAKDGKPGLAAQLMETATIIQAETEMHQARTTAALLLDKLHVEGAVLGSIDHIDERGPPQKLSDGSVIFSFERILKDLTWMDKVVTRPVLSKVVKMFGDKKAVRAKGRRFKRITPEGLARMDAFIDGEDEK